MKHTKCIYKDTNTALLKRYQLHIPYLQSFPTRRSSDLVAAFLAVPQDRVRNVAGQNFHTPRGRHQRYCVLGLADRKSTRLNFSHVSISYAVFCLKKKNKRCSSQGHIELHVNLIDRYIVW